MALLTVSPESALPTLTVSQIEMLGRVIIALDNAGEAQFWQWLSKRVATGGGERPDFRQAVLFAQMTGMIRRKGDLLEIVKGCPGATKGLKVISAERARRAGIVGVASVTDPVKTPRATVEAIVAAYATV